MGQVLGVLGMGSALVVLMLTLNSTTGTMDTLQHTLHEQQVLLETFGQSHKQLALQVTSLLSELQGLKKATLKQEDKSKTASKHLESVLDWMKEEKEASAKDREVLADVKSKVEKLSSRREALQQRLWGLEDVASKAAERLNSLEESHMQSMAGLAKRHEELKVAVQALSEKSGSPSGLATTLALVQAPSATQVGLASETSSRAPPLVPTSHSAVPGRSAGKKEYEISWYRECGCTEAEHESVPLLIELTHALGAEHVRTNVCDEDCAWPSPTQEVLTKIHVPENSLWTGGDATHEHVWVVAAGAAGMCFVPPTMSSQKERPPNLFRVSRSSLGSSAITSPTARSCERNFEEIWVPSKESIQAFVKAGMNEERLKVLRPVVSPSLFNCSIHAERSGARSVGIPRIDAFLSEPNSFILLTIFDWDSTVNWKLLLEVFWEAFPGPPKKASKRPSKGTAKLLFVVRPPATGPGPVEEMKAMLDSLPRQPLDGLERVLVYEKPVDAATRAALFRASDAFVLPKRILGGAQVLLEAMASGVPTIATGWGDQMEFMSQTNSEVLRFQTLKGTEGELAEPTRAALLEALRTSVDHAADLQQKADQSCEIVLQKHMSAAVSAQFLEHLEELAAEDEGSHEEDHDKEEPESTKDDADEHDEPDVAV